MAYLIGADTDDRTLSAMNHGLLSRSDLSFIRDRFTNGFNAVGRFGSTYLEKAKDLISNFDFDTLRNKVEVVSNRFGIRWDEDRIRPLTDMRELQTAKMMMRRYVMANTRISDLYHREMISGYNGKFFEQDFRGVDNDDYRQVTQGMYVGTDDEDRYVTRMDQLEPDNLDDVLTFQERETIREAWELAERLIDAGGQDPTSPNCNLL